MEAIKKIQDFIKGLGQREFYQYSAAFLGIISLLLGIILFFHYSKVSRYTNELEKINRERLKTKKILRESKLVAQQKATVDEILERDKTFFIGQTYNNIIQELGLSKNQTEEPTRSDGEQISGKVERILSAHLDLITTKQLVDLLSKISENERLYPKELAIKKTPNARTIDVDLTIATLEPINEYE